MMIILLLLCFNSLGASLYFMHVPKTGGTTLRLLLEEQLSVSEIYPFKNAQSATRSPTEDLVSGHFPYWFCKKFDRHFEEAFKVTILRDPMERYLSFLRAKKKADHELPDLESVLRLRQSSNNKYSEGLIDNAMCRYYSEDSSLEGDALLESAKKTLQTLDCVIFFDNFTQGVIDLFARLGIDLGSQDVLKINTTEKEAVSKELLAEVQRLNELDIQLYEYAKQHLQEKTTEYSLRTPSFEAVQKKTSFVDYTFDQPLWGRGWTYRDQEEMDPVYRWVMDYPAHIYFSLEPGSDYLLFFNAHLLNSQVVPRVQVNGLEIPIQQLDTHRFSRYQGFIPKECITEQPTDVTFYSTQAFQYRDVYPSSYNRNHPPLSFALNRIQVISIFIKNGTVLFEKDF